MTRREIVTAALTTAAAVGLAKFEVPIGFSACPRRALNSAKSALEPELPQHPISETLMANIDSRIQTLKFFGCATSHFQSEPILGDAEYDDPKTDWGHELRRNLKGLDSAICPKQVVADFPHLLEKAPLYVERSAELGNNMFRFSVDFGRLCPEREVFDAKLMARYVKLMGLIRASGQEPMITMHHFTMPKFLAEYGPDGRMIKGAWENPATLSHFRFFTKHVVKFLGDKDKISKILADEHFGSAAIERFVEEGLAKYFLSINEPAITPLNSYLTGVFPPSKQFRLFTAKKILGLLRDAHDSCFEEIKKLATGLAANRQPVVGVGYNWQYYDGGLGRLAHDWMNQYYTDSFERDGQYSDFIGLHYYFRQTAPFFSRRWKEREYGDMPTFGDVYPKGIKIVLTKMHRAFPSKPIFVSEIGFSDASDQRRPLWLLDTLRNIAEAQSCGIPILGVLVWSLVDNLEWDFGMSQKFGLFREEELTEPLREPGQGVRSWQVWKASAKAFLKSDRAAISYLEDVYALAKAQHARAESKPKGMHAAI